MAKMTGLGKGLDALFGGAPLDMPKQNVEPEQIENNENLKTLKIDPTDIAIYPDL